MDDVIFKRKGVLNVSSRNSNGGSSSSTSTYEGTIVQRDVVEQYLGPKVKGANHDFRVLRNKYSANSNQRLVMLWKQPNGFSQTDIADYSDTHAATWRHHGVVPSPDLSVLTPRVYKALQSPQTAVFIRELPEASRMIADRILKIVHFSTNLRKGNFAAIARQFKRDIKKSKKAALLKLDPSKRLASGYLEYQFGWAPLLGDIHEASKSLVKDGPDGVLHLTHRKSYTTRSDYERTYWGRKFYFTRTSTTRERLTLHLEFDMRAPEVLSRLGLTDPASIAWELLPFSFMVDYIVDVGGWLESRAAFNGYTFRNGWYSHVGENVVVDDPSTRTSVFSYGTEVRRTEGSAWIESSVYTRRILRAFPNLTPPCPTIDASSAHLGQVANLIALLRNVL